MVSLGNLKSPQTGSPKTSFSLPPLLPYFITSIFPLAPLNHLICPTSIPLPTLSFLPLLPDLYHSRPSTPCYHMNILRLKNCKSNYLRLKKIKRKLETHWIFCSLRWALETPRQLISVF